MAGASCRALGERPLHEVGVEYGRSVVGETLAKLSKGNGKDRPVHVTRHTAEGAELLLGRLVIVLLLRRGDVAWWVMALGDIDGAASGEQLLLCSLDSGRRHVGLGNFCRLLAESSTHGGWRFGCLMVNSLLCTLFCLLGSRNTKEMKCVVGSALSFFHLLGQQRHLGKIREFGGSGGGGRGN